MALVANPTREELLAEITDAERRKAAASQEYDALKRQIAAGNAWEGKTVKQYRMSYNANSPAQRLRGLEKQKEMYATVIRSTQEALNDYDRRARGADGLSSTAKLKERASKGDPDAQAALQARERFLGRGRFSTRQIPGYNDDTTGLQPGRYRSPLTGREVVVRAGGATILPAVAEASYTEKPAENLWSRDYFVTARVRENLYKKQPHDDLSPSVPKTPEARPTYPLASATVPVILAPDTGGPSVLPEGAGMTINVPRYFASRDDLRGTVTEVKRPGTVKELWEAPEQATGYGSLLGGEVSSSFSAGDYSQALAVAPKFFSYEFAGGLFKTLKGAYQDPLTTAGSVGAYVAVGAAGTAAGGPAGGALAIGGVFAAQNVYEFRAGETPTIIRAVQRPVGFGGEMSPFLAGGALYGSYAKARAARAEASLAGEIATPATAETIRGVPSVELRAAPLEAVRQVVQTTEDVAGSRSLGVQTPVFGEPVFLTAKDLESQPVAFLTDANINVLQRVRPASGSVPGLSAPAGSFSANLKATGRTNAQTLARAAEDRIIAAKGQKTALPPYLKRETLVTADYTFTPYEPPPAWELAVRPEQPGRPGPSKAKPRGPVRAGTSPPGRELGYEPKLDFFEQVAIATPEGTAILSESPYTGARRVSAQQRPYVILQVKAKPQPVVSTPPKKPAPGEVEIVQPDGTIVIQKLEPVVETPSVAKQTSVQETKQKTVTVTKKPVQKQTLAPDQRFKYVPQQQTGKPFAEVLVRFKGLSKLGGFPALRSSSSSSTVSAVGSGVGFTTAQTTAQTPATIQIQIPAVDQATATVQESATTTTQQTRQTTTPALRFRTPTRPQTPPPVTIPTAFPPPKTRDAQGDFFTVSVRRFGKFQPVGKGLRYEEAVTRGAGIVSATAAASFKITPEGERTSRSPFDIVSRQVFRPSKRETGVIVEKSRFRLTEPGELSEISRKGQTASRDKRKRKAFGGGFSWGF